MRQLFAYSPVSLSYKCDSPLPCVPLRLCISIVCFSVCAPISFFFFFFFVNSFCHAVTQVLYIQRRRWKRHQLAMLFDKTASIMQTAGTPVETSCFQTRPLPVADVNSQLTNVQGTILSSSRAEIPRRQLCTGDYVEGSTLINNGKETKLGEYATKVAAK